MPKIFLTAPVEFVLLSPRMETPPPDSSRRQALTWIAAAAAFAGLATWFGRSGKRTSPAPASTAPVTAPSEEAVTISDATTLDPEVRGEPMHPVYGPLLNTEFSVAHPDETTASCKLVAVSPVRTLTGPKGDYAAFSLLFEAKPDFLREGGICRVTHPKLNAMDLFLSPVGTAKGEIAHLEACFTERV